MANETGLAKFNQVIKSESTQNYLQTVLSKKKDQFVTSLTSLVGSNALLQRCEPLSVMYAAIKAAALDLPFEGSLGMAYCVPYGNQAQFQIGAKGLAQLAIRSGQFVKLRVTEVYEGEYAGIDRRTGEVKWNDVENADTKPVIGYYGYFKLLNGYEYEMYWSKEKALAHGKRYSKSFNSGPWKTHTDEMCKKGLALDTLIPTPDGFTTMGEIRVGDKVFNALGQITTVTEKSEVKHLPCYKITFQNGECFVCDHEHRWVVGGTNRRKGWITAEVKGLYEAKKLGYPIVTPCSPMVEMSVKDLPIEPWCLGYWIGNGSKKGAQVSCDAKDADEIANLYRPFYNVSTTKDKRNNGVTINISSLSGLRSDNSSLKKQLRENNLIDNKHIPMCYKRCSVLQRIELIRGLCDSDGCVDTQRGRCTFGSVNREIVEDVREILSSLGERAGYLHREAHGFGKTVDYYSVQWQPKNFIPFHLDRKVKKVRSRAICKSTSIESIEKVDSVPTQCIAVDCGNATDENDLRKTYLIGRSFQITHNTLLKRLLKEGNAPMSVEMKDAITYDQAVFDKEGNYGYHDNGNAPMADFSKVAEEAVAEEIPTEAVDTATGEIKNEQNESK